MARASFTYDSCIRGYHEYKSIGDASVGEILHCNHKPDNPYDDQQLQLFIVELPLAMCQGMCHEVFHYFSSWEGTLLLLLSQPEGIQETFHRED